SHQPAPGRGRRGRDRCRLVTLIPMRNGGPTTARRLAVGRIRTGTGRDTPCPCEHLGHPQPRFGAGTCGTLIASSRRNLVEHARKTREVGAWRVPFTTRVVDNTATVQNSPLDRDAEHAGAGVSTNDRSHLTDGTP